jgi:hypothetical protein
MKFDEKCAQLIFGKSTPGIFLYRDRNAENTAEFDRIMSSVASQVQGKIQVIVTDITEGLETRLAEYIGITSKDLPTVRIHDTRVDLKKYNLEGAITEESVLKFVNDWESGKLKAHLKSEEILIYEIPLLAESGSAKNFDLVITVEADLELRKERLRKREMFISEIERRIASQATREEREALADFVITNDGDEDQLLRAVENLWEELPSRAK